MIKIPRLCGEEKISEITKGQTAAIFRFSGNKEVEFIQCDRETPKLTADGDLVD